MHIERGKKQPEAHLDDNIAIVSNAGNVSNSDTDSCEVASLESASGVDSPQRAMGCTDNRVTLNIGGQYFTTYQSTIHSYPGTRLSSISRSDTAYDSASGEYFFDRNPRLFPYILDFYRSGELHFPHCTCGTVIQQELAFWGISDDKVATCCWRTYKEFEEEKRTLDELEEAFNGHKKMFRGKDNYRIRGSLTNGWTKWKMDVLKFLEDPSSSKPAKVM